MRRKSSYLEHAAVTVRDIGRNLLDEEGKDTVLRKKIANVMVAFCLLTTVLPAEAAKPELAQDTEVRAYKVQLHDTMDRAGFIKAYNQAAPEYPLGLASEPKAAGDYITTVSPIGDKEAIIINANGEGKLSNLIYMHKGKIAESELEQVYAVYAGILNALGYRAAEDHEVKYAQSFKELELTSTEAMAARFTREDNERIYTFYKSYNPRTDVCMILIEAVIEK